jgi:ROS/MUCR transcriptional regulator protein
MNDDAETLMTMTADIVAAHVSNSIISVSDLPLLIASVHDALAGLGGIHAASAPVVDEVPAISVKASVWRPRDTGNGIEGILFVETNVATLCFIRFCSTAPWVV